MWAKFQEIQVCQELEKDLVSQILGDSSVPRVEKGPCKLDFRDSSVLRVEKGPCKIELRNSSVLRVEKGPCKLKLRGFKCAKG